MPIIGTHFCTLLLSHGLNRYFCLGMVIAVLGMATIALAGRDKTAEDSEQTPLLPGISEPSLGNRAGASLSSTEGDVAEATSEVPDIGLGLGLGLGLGVVREPDNRFLRQGALASLPICNHGERNSNPG